MANNAKTIWDYLTDAGCSEAGAAGLMGNLYAESGLDPTNLQDSYEKKLGYTDDTYTTAVDNGEYTDFASDSAGYGLAQWTYSTRKENLLSYAESKGKSIGNLNMQLGFLVKELKGSYSSVWSTLKSAEDVKTASDAVLTKFEKPADQSNSVKTKRAAYGQEYYDKYASQTTSSSLTVDGIWGKATTRKAQDVFGTTVDGIVSNQLKSCKKYLTAADEDSWEFETSKKGGSKLIKAIQKKVSVTQDGYAGENTVKGIQSLVGTTKDGILGKTTAKAWQKWLNKQ